MGRVTYDVVIAGDPRSAASVQDILDDLVTQSGNIEAVNLAVGGIEKRNLVQYASRRTFGFEDSTPVAHTNTAWATAQVGGGPSNVEIDFNAILGADITLGDYDKIDIAAACQFTSGAGGGVPANRWASIGISTSTPTVTTNQPLTERYSGGSVVVTQGDCVFTRYQLVGPKSGANVVRKCAMICKLNGGAGTFYIAFATLVAVLRRKVQP